MRPLSSCLLFVTFALAVASSPVAEAAFSGRGGVSKGGARPGVAAIGRGPSRYRSGFTRRGTFRDVAFAGRAGFERGRYGRGCFGGREGCAGGAFALGAYGIGYPGDLWAGPYGYGAPRPYGPPAIVSNEAGLPVAAGIRPPPVLPPAIYVIEHPGTSSVSGRRSRRSAAAASGADRPDAGAVGPRVIRIGRAP